MYCVGLLLVFLKSGVISVSTAGVGCMIMCGLVFYFEVIQQGFELILGCEAGVSKEAVGFAPVAQASVVEQFKFICDDEWDYVVCQAFFEHDESSYASVSVLERVDAFEFAMEVDDVLQCFVFYGVVRFKQRLDLSATYSSKRFLLFG